jgi:nucleotide-binding universal stress UspA family protein
MMRCNMSQQLALRPHATYEVSVMFKVLIPVDGSACSERAVRHVVKLAGMTGELVVELINVQPAANAWEVKRFLREEEIANLHEALSEEATRTARALLDRAAIAFTVRHLVGEVAETIAQYAGTCGCDQIVMGSRGHTALEGLLLGSISTKVLHLAQVPLTLIK